jgi:putative glutamine amidotransferase
VLRAGGEPLTLHPWAPGEHVTTDEVAERLSFVDGVLLPGGGDLTPSCYGAEVSSEHVYDTDVEQDAFDLAVARWAVAAGVPLLAVCRGMQVTAVAHGATLVQHMQQPHRPVRHHVDVDAGTALANLIGTQPEVSCFHHQCIESLGPNLTAIARAHDHCIEAIEFINAPGWVTAVQWHPEDLAAPGTPNQHLFDALVREARRTRT